VQPINSLNNKATMILKEDLDKQIIIRINLKPKLKGCYFFKIKGEFVDVHYYLIQQIQNPKKFVKSRTFSYLTGPLSLSAVDTS